MQLLPCALCWLPLYIKEGYSNSVHRGIAETVLISVVCCSFDRGALARVCLWQRTSWGHKRQRCANICERPWLPHRLFINIQTLRFIVSLRVDTGGRNVQLFGENRRWYTAWTQVWGPLNRPTNKPRCLAMLGKQTVIACIPTFNNVVRTINALSNTSRTNNMHNTKSANTQDKETPWHKPNMRHFLGQAFEL